MTVYKIFAQPIIENVEVLYETDSTTNKRTMYLQGIGLQSDIKNKNTRIYEERVLDESVNKYLSENIEQRRVGELKHPKNDAHTIDEDRISHLFTEIEKNGKNWWLKGKVLPTTCGEQLRNLVEGGIQMGWSSRCLGTIKEKNGINYVQPGLKIVSLSDAVMTNSAPDALVDAIYENCEFILENGKLVQKDLSEDIDNYQKLIKNSTKENRAKIFESIILDYFDKILK